MLFKYSSKVEKNQYSKPFTVICSDFKATLFDSKNDLKILFLPQKKPPNIQ